MCLTSANHSTVPSTVVCDTLSFSADCKLLSLGRGTTVITNYTEKQIHVSEKIDYTTGTQGKQCVFLSNDCNIIHKASCKATGGGGRWTDSFPIGRLADALSNHHAILLCPWRAQRKFVTELQILPNRNLSSSIKGRSVVGKLRGSYDPRTEQGAESRWNRDIHSRQS